MAAGHIATTYISQRRRKYDAQRQRAITRVEKECCCGGVEGITNYRESYSSGYYTFNKPAPESTERCELRKNQ